MDKLKPCPFCGGEAAFLGETQSIKCKQCGCMFIVTNPFTTRLEAKEAWNGRVNDASVRHGHWIGEGDGYADGELVFDVWHCSECDYCIDDGTDDPERLPKYCPGCGALMDGGNEGE